MKRVPPAFSVLSTAARRRRGFLTASAAAAGALALPTRLLAAPAGATTAPAWDAADVYFEETGHVVSGAFWRLWRTYGLDAFGYPITEAFDDGGVVNQYFQRMRFERAPDGAVRLGLLGIEAGGARPVPAADAANGAGASGAPAPAEPGSRLVAETGQVVSGAFVGAYDRWQAVLGPPIAPEFPTPSGYAQYFAHGRLEWDAQNGTRLSLLGSEIAAARGVDTTAVAAPPGMTTWSTVAAALVADEGERRALGLRVSGTPAFVPAFGEQWIAVSLPQQRVTAYEHTRPVFTDLVSTGAAAKGLTSKGIFAINRRVANETMDSTSIGIPKGDPKYYRLENVLYTQYFDNAGSALHYAWWHNNFGTPMSYGCVNLRLATAKWFWEWATIGTRVVIA